MPTPQPDTREKAPDRIELVWAAGDIVIEAAMPDGDSDPTPRFSMIAYTGGAMRIEGMRHPVVVDLEGLQIPSQRRPVRFGHSMYAGVGHTERIAIENGRLVAEGIVSRDTGAAREVVASGKRGFPWQASIGAAVRETEFVRAGKSASVNGRTLEGPLYIARKTTLGEISFVDLGADTNTTVQIAAQQQESQLMDETKDTDVTQTEEQDTTTPKAPGNGQSGATETSNVTRDAQSDAAGTEAGASGDTVSEVRAQAVEETQRIVAIREVCAGRYSEIEAQAITEGWSRDKCELAVLRESRPKAPAVHVVESTIDGHVLEAACMLTGRLSDIEKLHDDRTLEAADRRFRGGITLQELLLEAAWANGYTGRNFRNSREVLRHAFATDLRAAFSTIDIGGMPGAALDDIGGDRDRRSPHLRGQSELFLFRK